MAVALARVMAVTDSARLAFQSPDTEATAVLIDEHDAGGFEGSANGDVVGGCHKGLSIS